MKLFSLSEVNEQTNFSIKMAWNFDSIFGFVFSHLNIYVQYIKASLEILYHKNKIRNCVGSQGMS
jgi:hypothetical protein